MLKMKRYPIKSLKLTAFQKKVSGQLSEYLQVEIDRLKSNASYDFNLGDCHGFNWSFVNKSVTS